MNNVIDIKEALNCKKCKDYLKKGGALYMTTIDESGKEKKYKLTLKGTGNEKK